MKTSYLQCFLLVAFAVSLSHAKSPHIVFIVADDLGWNDVGFHNPDMKTPNIDKLAREGIILNQSYVQPVCSPSRNSFLSGIYPFKSGLQHIVIFPEQAVCAPLNFTYLPQKLKGLGYSTHAIGKWHLGFCKWECTPTYRGFDTFFGYYNGAEDYYTHDLLGGDDFRDNKDTMKADGEYSANLYARRANQIIAKHNTSQPLFLYLPFQSVHNPIQVPKKYEDMYPNIQNDGRRQYCGMVSALDEAIGNITLALQQRGIYDDTLIIFTADNGGWPTYYGNNYPLRGSKVTVFEGGTRAAAFVHGAGLQKKGFTYDGMMHAVDWMPTIVSAAGGSMDTSAIDGVDQWGSIREGGVSKRTEFIYNLDDMDPAPEGEAAIRVNDFKLIDGYPGRYPDWYKPQTEHKDYVIKQAPYDEFANGTMLFNVKDDPNERNDLSKSHPEIVEQLRKKMDEYRKQMVPANFPPQDDKANPKNYNGFWSPGWC